MSRGGPPGKNAYEVSGRRTGLTHADGQEFTYKRDTLGRVSNVRTGESYAWDRAAMVNRAYAANGLNQYTQSGSITPTYDVRGNLTSAGPVSYAYDSQNMLRSTSDGITFHYDPFDRLVEYDTTVSTRFVHDGAEISAEVDNPAGAILRRYVRGDGADELIAWYEGSGTSDRRFLSTDERGSIISVTDGSGALLAINSYDEYGIPGSANVGRFQYTGQAWLPELGMYHYKNRIYSPTLGRFLQTDPIGTEGGINLYAYVTNDPINFTDPLGLDGGTIVVTGSRIILLMGLKGFRYPASPMSADPDEENAGEDITVVGERLKAKFRKLYRAIAVNIFNWCNSPPISAGEAVAARNGDRLAFWKSRQASGDPLAATALSIVNMSNWAGQYANVRLRDAISSRSPTASEHAISTEVKQIGVELMRAHVNAVNTFGSPSAAQVAAYHFQVFNRHGLPSSTFGGAMITGSEAEAALGSVAWRQCF